MEVTGIIHRDIKPANLLLGMDDSLKISDFGLSKKYLKTDVQTRSTGSKYYMAPEVHNSSNYDQKCDVWSAAITFYTILTKSFIFSTSNQNQLLRGWDRIKNYGFKFEDKDNYDEIWDKLFSRMIVHDSKKRASFEQLLQLIRSAPSQPQQTPISRLPPQMPQIQPSHPEPQAKNRNTRSAIIIKDPKHKQVARTIELWMQYQFDRASALKQVLRQIQGTNVCGSNQATTVIVFLCTAAYVSAMKKLLNSLKQPNRGVPDSDEVFNPLLLSKTDRQQSAEVMKKYQQYSGQEFTSGQEYIRKLAYDLNSMGFAKQSNFPNYGKYFSQVQDRSSTRLFSVEEYSRCLLQFFRTGYLDLYSQTTTQKLRSQCLLVKVTKLCFQHPQARFREGFPKTDVSLFTAKQLKQLILEELE